MTFSIKPFYLVVRARRLRRTVLWLVILLYLTASGHPLQAAQSRNQNKPSLNHSGINRFQDATKQIARDAKLPNGVHDKTYNSILQRLSKLEAEYKASSADALLRGWLAVVISFIAGVIGILGFRRTLSLDNQMKAEPYFRFMWKSCIPLLASHIDETLAWCELTPLDIDKENDFPWRTIHGIDYHQELSTPDKSALKYHTELARAIARYAESTKSLLESLNEFNELVYPTSEEWYNWTQTKGMYQLTIDGNSSEERKDQAARNQEAFNVRNKEVRSLVAKYTNKANPTVKDLKSSAIYRQDLSRLHEILQGRSLKAYADAKNLKGLLAILSPLYDSTDQ
jgi:hypothetical protein